MNKALYAFFKQVLSFANVSNHSADNHKIETMMTETQTNFARSSYAQTLPTKLIAVNAYLEKCLAKMYNEKQIKVMVVKDINWWSFIAESKILSSSINKKLQNIFQKIITPVIENNVPEPTLSTLEYYTWSVSNFRLQDWFIIFYVKNFVEWCFEMKQYNIIANIDCPVIAASAEEFSTSESDANDFSESDANDFSESDANDFSDDDLANNAPNARVNNPFAANIVNDYEPPFGPNVRFNGGFTL